MRKRRPRSGDAAGEQRAEGPDAPRLSWGVRLQHWRERNPVLGLLFLGSSLVTAISVLTLAILDVYDRYQRHFEWRAIEYRKLTSLRAGFELDKFTDVLGAPVFVLRRQRYDENIFHGRDYWVQAVADHAGTVQEYAVTSCSTSFRPTFSLHPARKMKVTLQESTIRSVSQLASVELGGDWTSLVKRAYVSGAHTTTLYDEISPGNVFLYKLFAWGVDDACPPLPKIDFAKIPSPFVDLVARAPEPLKNAGQNIVNTYAETTGVTFDSLPIVQVGVHPQIARLLPK